MGMNFEKVMQSAVEAFEERMNRLHEEYMHLFHDSDEEDGADIQEMVDRTMKSFDDICVTVEEVGGRILARRKKPKVEPESPEQTKK